MKKLLIIKTGTSFYSIRKVHGDFEDFIINQIDITPKHVLVASVYKNESLPDLSQVSGIIITGSHSMVTDYDKWSIHLSQWLRELVYMSIPVLGICYGHQILAKALGGHVDYNSEGKEIGTVKIELTPQGETDLLLGVLPKTFLGHVTHAQTITRLPNNVRLLARNAIEKHHSFGINKNIWGVQFHPEFNADITLAYIYEQQEILLKEAYDINKLHSSVKEHNYGKLLLNRFIELI